MKPLVLFIVGPTACGKSQIAIEVAKRLGGEIISADSMLVYKGMDIGTAKPSSAERRKVPHHLIDLFAASRNFSVFDYRKKAVKKIQEIVKKKKLPIIVGGSGLYVRALSQGLAEQPAADLKLRKRLALRARSEGLASLYKEFQSRDPLRASKIKSGDARRIIRALEILHCSNGKPSELRGREQSLESLGYQVCIVGITKDRQLLYQDIERRVDGMFRKGLVREVKTLSRQRLSRTARQAVGYKEILAVLKDGGSLDQAKELIKKNTRHLAKRQWTWFKREKGLRWLNRQEGVTVREMAQNVMNLMAEALNKDLTLEKSLAILHN